MSERPGYYRRGRRPVYCSEECRPRTPPPPPRLTDAEYADLFTAQNGECAICLQPERAFTRAGVRKRLAVDHDHVTDEIRGLLCQGCNTALGSMQDDVVRLAAAIAYLQRRGA